MAQPMYRQIAEELRGQIDSGRLQPGQQLQTESQLKKHYGASRNTIRDAIKWLTSLGLVETRPGQGTFVVEAIEPFISTLTADPTTWPGGGEGATYRSEVHNHSRKASSSPPQVAIQMAVSDVATRLRVPEGTQVISRHQCRYIDPTPWSLQTSLYPMAFAAQGAVRLIQAEDIEEGAVAYLARTLGIKQVAYCDWIKVRAPNAVEAEFFNLPPDGRVGVFEIFRTAFDQEGHPMRLTVTVLPTDRNQFIVRIGDAIPTTQGGGLAKH